MNFRVGLGYDVHPLVEGRPLVLGGILIPHHKGLDGHSDADVLIHALMDALLGALALGDIGTHFPNTNPAYKNADSLELLKEVGAMIAREKFQIQNVDVMIIVEAPKVMPYIGAMRGKIADTLGITIQTVSIKATTNEKMGFLGREEGIAAQAIALLYKN